MTRRYVFALIVALASLVGVVVPPATAATTTKLALLTTETAAVVIGDTVWLALMWEASGDLRNFEVTVSQNGGAEIGYPANTRDRAGPYQSANLLAGEIDYTAISFRYPEEAAPKRVAELVVVATWDGDRIVESQRFTVTVPLVLYRGNDLNRLTDAVSIRSGQIEWVEIAYSGLAPRLTDFTLIVDAPETIGIVYPAYGAATSLHFDSTLEDGETDVARFRVDASTADPGIIELGIVTSYRRGETGQRIPEVITLEIVP